jgi:hypothetical protein
MKKSILLFSTVALFTFSMSFAQESSKKAPRVKSAKTTQVAAPKVQGPGMSFINDVMDYGTIELQADGAREFTFTNNGTQPLVISNAQGSCGCTVPSYTREPIAPGATGIIGVKYDTNRAGAFTKTITLTSNSAATPSKVLTIKGNVLPAPATAPAVKS